jgi:peptidoglycan/LPS O-acetylase OafA/YrhL
MTAPRGPNATPWYARRLVPTASAGTGGRDMGLEGLRGICACLVLYGHMTIPKMTLDPGYAPSSRLWWFNLGSSAVLFFFVLSGYVIGFTVREPFSGPGARAYASRRLVRLTPVNTAAVLLSFALMTLVPPAAVLGNLAFLQNFSAYPFGVRIIVMPDNLNLWSLNFEALYYVAFLAVWRMAPRAGWVLLVIGAAASAAAVLPGSHLMASGYAYGALYWIAGLAAAWLAAPTGRPGNWPSAMLAVAAMCRLATLERALGLAHLLNGVAWLPIPSLHRLDILPAFVWLILAVTGRSPIWQRRLALACLTWASIGLAWGLFAGDVAEPGAMACYAAAIALAWLLAGWRPATSLLARVAPVGAISYAIYAVGFPIQYGLLKVNWLPSGSAWSYCLRAALLVATTFGLAWILEKKLQPAVRRAFSGRARGAQS